MLDIESDDDSEDDLSDAEETAGPDSGVISKPKKASSVKSASTAHPQLPLKIAKHMTGDTPQHICMTQFTLIGILHTCAKRTISAAVL